MPEVLPSMSGWWNRRSLVTRLLMYAVAVLLAFVMAASVGPVAALVLSGNLSWLTGERSGPEEPGPAGEQGKSPQRQQVEAGRSQQEHQEHTDRLQQDKADAKREKVASVDKQT